MPGRCNRPNAMDIPLRQHPAQGVPLRRRDALGGKPLRVRYDRQHGTAEAFDAEGGALPGVMACWFAWVAFHRGTEVLRAP